MKLENSIKWSIYNYPTLYRDNTYEKSRIPVLCQYFLTIGNGLEWHPDGFLSNCSYSENGVKYVYEELEELPQGFFEKELFIIDVEKSRKKEVEDFFGDKFYYFLEREFIDYFYCVFESTEDESKEIRKKYSYKYENLFSLNCDIPARKAKWRMSGMDNVYWKPYEICQYSAIMNMIKGRTNSFKIKNFDLTNIKEDWIQGAIDIAKYAIEYYSTEEMYITCSYHPLKSGGCTEETWDNIRSEQLKILNKFLEKFDVKKDK